MGNRKKILTRLLLTAIIITVLLFIGNTVVKNIVTKKFNSVLGQFEPFVQSKYKQMHINILSGSVKIDSLYIVYHPELQHSQYQHVASFSSVKISGINYFKLISGKTSSASALQLNKANIQLDSYLLDKQDATADSLFSKVKLPFDKVFFGKIELPDAVVKKRKDTKEATLFTAAITLIDAGFHHTDSAFSVDNMHFSNVHCTLKNIVYTLPGYHSVHVKKLILSSKDSMLQIDSLKLIPQLGKFELGKKLGHQADHINASVSSITMKGLDVMQLQQKKLIAAEMNINQSIVYFFRDRRLPRKMEKQPTSADYLKQIPFDVHIGHFKLNDATVTSEEFPKEGNESGYIKIAHINIAMQPLYNRSSKSNNMLTSYISGNIMNAGKIQAAIHLSLLTGNENIKGTIENLKLPALNPSAEKLGRFHIESGILNKLNFEFTTTSKKASGQIIGEYHDLVIERLKNTKDGQKTAWVPTAALKTFIIPKNKDASLPVKRRTGKIDFERDPTRLVTFFYIKALLDGIRDSFDFGFLLPK